MSVKLGELNFSSSSATAKANSRDVGYQGFQIFVQSLSSVLHLQTVPEYPHLRDKSTGTPSGAARPWMLQVDGFCADFNARGALALCSYQVSRSSVSFTHYVSQHLGILLCNFMQSVLAIQVAVVPKCFRCLQLIVEYLGGKKYYKLSCL